MKPNICHTILQEWDGPPHPKFGSDVEPTSTLLMSHMHQEAMEKLIDQTMRFSKGSRADSQACPTVA